MKLYTYFMLHSSSVFFSGLLAHRDAPPTEAEAVGGINHVTSGKGLQHPRRYSSSTHFGAEDNPPFGAFVIVSVVARGSPPNQL